MAPALVEEALPIREAAAAKTSIKESFNKEFLVGGREGFNKAAETEGTAAQPPATYPNYLPVWDNEKGVK
jgi:sulfonate dioxygenase